jgi:hypothetical protein
MKGFQWSKLSYQKIKGTIWEKYPEVYKGIAIDYNDLEESFAAKQLERKESRGTIE